MITNQLRKIAERATTTTIYKHFFQNTTKKYIKYIYIYITQGEKSENKQSLRESYDHSNKIKHEKIRFFQKNTIIIRIIERVGKRKKNTEIELLVNRFQIKSRK